MQNDSFDLVTACLLNVVLQSSLKLNHAQIPYISERYMKHNAAHQHERERYNSRREKNP